jgi:predicted unusual protein kinase regulating ubiquinone biosynthesis (AarF/ABC1/UbiB family)
VPREDDPAARAVQDLIRQLGARPTAVPTTSLGRLRRTAGALLRGRSVLLPGDTIDPDVVARLVQSFGELKGVAMKMGQILSYVDDALPPEASALLGVLRTWSPPTPFATVAEILRADLGDRAAPLLATLDPDPVSSASIGQVHRGRLPGGRPVAVKVRHPGIDDAIRADFRSAWAGVALARLMVPGADVQALVAEAKAGFLEECDYRLEARRQQRFVDLCAADERVVIPEVHHQWSAERVLTTDWHDGMSLEALLATQPAPAERARRGRAHYYVYVGQH